MEKIKLDDGLLHFISGPEDFRSLIRRKLGDDAADYLSNYFRKYNPDSVPDFDYEKCAPDCEMIQKIQSKIESFFDEIDVEIRKIYSHEISKNHVDVKLIMLVNQAKDTVMILKKQVKKSLI